MRGLHWNLMDLRKYYDITHQLHTVMNPQSKEKFDELIGLLDLKPGSKVLDIGCGKGEFLIRLANSINIKAVGIDLSPYVIKEAIERSKGLLKDSSIRYVESDGKAYLEEESSEYDLTSCMGASWIFGGHEGTIKAMMKVTKKNGIIIAGEPYWIKEPSDWYLETSGVKYEDFLTNAGNLEVGEKLGLRPMYVMVSNLDDWDRYEGLQSLATDRYVKNNPEDEDNEELIKRVSKYRTAYIREGRDVLGWALYVFRIV